jgi:hypothetical protein
LSQIGWNELVHLLPDGVMPIQVKARIVDQFAEGLSRNGQSVCMVRPSGAVTALEKGLFS